MEQITTSMTGYTLSRSKRKTIAIYIRGGNVEVRAPIKMPKRDIDRFIASKEKWITDKLMKSREQSECRESFKLNYGDTIAYRGKLYPIVAKEGERAGFDGEQFYISPNLTPEQIKSVCVQIYRKLAKMYLTEQTEHFGKQMDVTPTAIKINSAKTRWGSCSAKGNINFSWRIIMAEDAVIDYIVIHELAHIMEMNHSARFWATVACVLPDFKARQTQLKELQRRLGGENWE